PRRARRRARRTPRRRRSCRAGWRRHATGWLRATSELRRGLEVEGAPGALDPEEVERRLIGEVLDLAREAQRQGGAFHLVDQREGVHELRVDRLFVLPQPDALPAAEELVHVAGVPGEGQRVVGSRSEERRVGKEGRDGGVWVQRQQDQVRGGREPNRT